MDCSFVTRAARVLGCRVRFALIPLSLAGCVTTDSPPPTVVSLQPRIENTLACIRKTGVLYHRTFVVGAFADSTGKINSVAPGSTGDYLPQGGSASYITDALDKAGATVVTTYFGAPHEKVPAEYDINGIFNSLDFDSPFAGDVQINGIGPTAGYGWADLTLTIQLDAAGTRVNHQIALIQRPVRYVQIGLGGGTTSGSTLLTGSLVLQHQDRLQFEALDGPIALGVADVVMKEFPRARHDCWQYARDLLRPQ